MNEEELQAQEDARNISKKLVAERREWQSRHQKPWYLQ